MILRKQDNTAFRSSVERVLKEEKTQNQFFSYEIISRSRTTLNGEKKDLTNERKISFQSNANVH